MVQKIHLLGMIWVPNFDPYVWRFQIWELLSKYSILMVNLKTKINFVAIFQTRVRNNYPELLFFWWKSSE